MQELPLTLNRNEDPTPVKLSTVDAKEVSKKFSELNFCLEHLISQFNEGKLTEGFKNTMLSLSEHYLADMLKAFGYDGILKKEMEDRFKEIRSINEQNRELRSQLGNKVSNEDVREKIKNMNKTVSNWWRKYGFGHVSEKSCEEYGMVVKLSCSIFPDYDDETHTRKSKKSKVEYLQDYGFQLLQESEGSDHYDVIDNDNNKKLLIQLITNKYPSAYFTESKSFTGRKDAAILRDFNIVIKDYNEII